MPSAKQKPLLAVTMGDVNGIGPEILAKALSRGTLDEYSDVLILGSIPVLEKVRSFIPFDAVPVEVALTSDLRQRSGVFICDAGFRAPEYRPGMLDPGAGTSAVEWIKCAVRLALDGAVDGVVTCPINKECIRSAGHEFIGHTDLIADMTESPDYRMCLFSDSMRIVHISAHCSLRDAIGMVKRERIATSIRIADTALKRLDLPTRRIAVAGLNPHAGEAGAFGNEESSEIAPAIAECRAEGIDCSGPFPPDTIFRRMREGEFDLVVAMYHDQGHIALKLVAMDEGVNVTLGIPIVRTSVDHGTAYDIAGRGTARESSLLHALCLAATMARMKCKHPTGHRG